MDERTFLLNNNYRENTLFQGLGTIIQNTYVTIFISLILTFPVIANFGIWFSSSFTEWFHLIILIGNIMSFIFLIIIFYAPYNLIKHMKETLSEVKQLSDRQREDILKMEKLMNDEKEKINRLEKAINFLKNTTDNLINQLSEEYSEFENFFTNLKSDINNGLKNFDSKLSIFIREMNNFDNLMDELENIKTDFNNIMIEFKRTVEIFSHNETLRKIIDVTKDLDLISDGNDGIRSKLKNNIPLDVNQSSKLLDCLILLDDYLSDFQSKISVITRKFELIF